MSVMLQVSHVRLLSFRTVNSFAKISQDVGLVESTVKKEREIRAVVTYLETQRDGLKIGSVLAI